MVLTCFISCLIFHPHYSKKRVLIELFFLSYKEGRRFYKNSNDMDWIILKNLQETISSQDLEE